MVDADSVEAKILKVGHIPGADIVVLERVSGVSICVGRLVVDTYRRVREED